jgi:hypothetical protein
LVSQLALVTLTTLVSQIALITLTTLVSEIIIMTTLVCELIAMQTLVSQILNLTILNELSSPVPTNKSRSNSPTNPNNSDEPNNPFNSPVLRKKRSLNLRCPTDRPGEAKPSKEKSAVKLQIHINITELPIELIQDRSNLATGADSMQ